MASKRPLKEWTDDEMTVLDECARESFWYRSLPCSAAFGTATYLAVQRGTFKPNKRFGAIPKVLLAIVGGYFVGQFSYATACLDKFMRLPYSPFADEVRRKRAERK